jgi:hypothetical protein
MNDHFLSKRFPKEHRYNRVENLEGWGRGGGVSSSFFPKSPESRGFLKNFLPQEGGGGGGRGAFLGSV